MNQTRARIRAWAVKTATSEADREALARVTARLRIVKPDISPYKLNKIPPNIAAAWAKTLTAQMQGKSVFAQLAQPSNLSGKRAYTIIMDDIVDDRIDDRIDAMRYAFGAMNIRKPADFGFIETSLCAV